jgi:hypothetical protein
VPLGFYVTRKLSVSLYFSCILHCVEAAMIIQSSKYELNVEE